jgi:uncharacterized protein YbjT (DUF2867 family)
LAAAIEMEAEMAEDHGRAALVAGATGLVGREILAALLADKGYTAVHSIGRRKIVLEHPKLVQQLVDFTALPRMPKVDDVFIALGTTIKVAGSQAAFRAVDFEAVQAVAKAGRAAGATKLGVVSAMGADDASAIFYNRVKGEMEEALIALKFPCAAVARPSMLAGQRETLEQPTRSGERIALGLSRALGPLIPANYRPIDAKDVAQALIQAVKSSRSGVYRLLSGEMQGASKRQPD